MAGECLSYGAFGAYSSSYTRCSKDQFPISYDAPPVRSTRSWKTFLPDVILQSSSDKAAARDIEELSDCYEYDHVKHSGLANFNPEVTWVIQRFSPLDERTYAPVPRFKYVCRHDGTPPPRKWIPPRHDTDPGVSKFWRASEEKEKFHSTPYTRDEQWSTLREMLPSKGRALSANPSSWGTGGSTAPEMIGDPQRRFPIINSPMSRFVADMHLTNREFKLF